MNSHANYFESKKENIVELLEQGKSVTKIAREIGVHRLTLGIYCRNKGLKKARFPKKTYPRLFWIWDAIVQRTTNPKCSCYKNYGGRGIGICEQWLKYENFRKDMEASHDLHVKNFGVRNTSIDRINNEQGYCKENCKWSTNIEQANNRRNSRVIEAFGESQTLAQWSRETGLGEGTINFRIKKGWEVERALTQKLRKDIIREKREAKERDTTTAKYYCKHCQKVVVRKSNQRWMNSVCEKTGKKTHITNINTIRSYYER